ncbi:MAG TPA: DUF5011 domain-containing protein [Candidatus Hydrogenedentes bacterium]|nr:DUF5011 domain-containing protein [Candidatus Hydrogenedentota bacterium]
MRGNAGLSHVRSFFFAVVMLLIVCDAFAETTMTMSRTVEGLGPDGHFIPGTTQLSFTVTLELGGDMARVRALAVEETLPEGWTFAGSAPTGNAPNLYPEPGDSGMGAFIWFSIPTFPASFTYTVNIPADVVAPVTLSGQALFRTTDGELASNVVESVIQNPIVATRTVTGTVGPDGAYYRPGTNIDVTVTFTRTFTDSMTAFAFVDTLPDDWIYLEESIGGSSLPNLTEVDGNQVFFVWFSIPTFPLTLTYQIAIPSDATGENCLSGLAYFRTDGLEQQSNTVEVCLSEEPCLTLERAVPTQCYMAGQDLTVNITLTSTCSLTFQTIMGLIETLPAGWTFVSSTGGDIPPNVGDSGTIQFGWIWIPAFPYTFSYVVHVPEEQTGDVSISGQGIFMFGPDLSTFIMDTVVCEADLSPHDCDIYLLGDSEMMVECGAEFVEPGFFSDCEGEWVIDNPVDPHIPNDYSITYTFYPIDNVDGYLEPSESFTRIVYVVDTLPPELTLLGDAAMAVECGTGYADAGATALDTCNGAVYVVVMNPVNTAVPGDYTITYNAVDASGNAAVEATRTVTVQDTTPPVITMNGPSPISVECHTSYTDAGATALDACDDEVAVDIAREVDVTNPGSYMITYDAVDTAGNNASQTFRIVNVVDTIAPIIVLNGPSTVEVNLEDNYNDPGAIATDNCDATINLDFYNSVNTHAIGSYTVIYTATDASGNTHTVGRTVNVVDHVPPVITLIGEAAMTVECGDPFIDPGATAMDLGDGDITARIVSSGEVNVSVTGVYTITYTVSDAAGNEAVPVTRTVTIMDTTGPGFFLFGDEFVTVECGGEYIDAGVGVMDACDGSTTVVVDNPVNTAVTGDYTVTYTGHDSSGNEATPITRTVTVTDTIAPTIIVNGDSPMTVECGWWYVEMGATATDDCDGDVEVTVGGDTVDTSVQGDYIVLYTAVDTSSNTATATRLVKVADTIAPILTLEGTNPLKLSCGEAFVDRGVIATDACDASVMVVATGDVDVNTTGEYTMTYNASDAAGNDATPITRTVIVEECCEDNPLCFCEGDPYCLCQYYPESCDPCILHPDLCINPCDECALEIAITSPTGDIAVPMGANVLVNLASVVYFYTAECTTHRVQVVYYIDGNPVAVSTNRSNGFAATTTLIEQITAYTLIAILRDLDTGCEVEVTKEFFVRPGTDEDNNGLPDNPFAQLPNDGDRWDAIVPGVSCPRAISMLSWTNPVGADILLTVVRPDDETQSVTATVPRGLINVGEQGILIVTLSCDLIGLLGNVEAAKIPSEPAFLAAGGVPFLVSVIVSSDGGASFNELDSLDIPVTLSLNGLAFSPHMNATFLDYPSDVTKDDLNRVQITIPDSGAWSSEAIDNPVAFAGALTAETTRLSVFEAIEESALPPTISVSPNPAYEFLVGVAHLDDSITNVIKVKNIGSGVLNGMATLNDPCGAFSIIGAANYSLTYGQTTAVTIRFAPNKCGSFTAALVFSNTYVTPNQQTVVTLRGETATADCGKPASIFGCAPISPESGYFSDYWVMAGVLMVVCAAGWRKKRT